MITVVSYPKLLDNGKMSAGRLDKTVPEPKWLADPTHRTKCVAKPIYALAAANKSKSHVTKLDAMRIKKYYAYFIKQSRSLPFDKMKK